jgi:hypothetical protein
MHPELSTRWPLAERRVAMAQVLPALALVPPV